MKGVVFTEFLEMVRSVHSENLLDAVLDDAAPPNGGAYTAVGTYDHNEMTNLVVAYAKHTQTTVPEALRTFGVHLLGRFHDRFPRFFAVDGVFAFLADVNAVIHVEVHKLYSDAELPQLNVLERTETTMTVLYRSSRHLEDLAEGLIVGAVAYFGEPMRIERQPHESGGVQFRLFRESVP
jgi:hypothetical protein